MQILLFSHPSPCNTILSNPQINLKARLFSLQRQIRSALSKPVNDCPEVQFDLCICQGLSGSRQKTDGMPNSGHRRTLQYRLTQAGSVATKDGIVPQATSRAMLIVALGPRGPGRQELPELERASCCRMLERPSHKHSDLAWLKGAGPAQGRCIWRWQEGKQP